MGVENVLGGVDFTATTGLDLEATNSSLCLILDARLSEGERLRLRWLIAGAVTWNDGPHLDEVSMSAESGLGGVDAWLDLGENREMIEGAWGSVVIDQPSHSVETLA